MSDAATECVDCPCESRETVDANGVELEGRREGMSESESVDEADGDAGQRIEPADTPNESEELITVSIKPENLESSGIPRVRLGGMWMQTGDVNGPGSQADESSGQTDGVGSQTDVSIWHGDVLSVETDMYRPANETANIRLPCKKVKLPDIPVEDARCTPDESDGRGNHMDASSIRTDGHSDGDESETSANIRINVRMGRIDLKPRNSPEICKITTVKPIGQWRGVSASCTDVHVPLSAPIDTASRNFVFGWLESGDEAIVPSLEGKRVIEGDGNQSGGDGDDGDGDDTESGGSVDSQRVEGAWLSTESQYTCQSQRMQDGDSPVSSRPPIRPAEHPYGDVRC